MNLANRAHLIKKCKSELLLPLVTLEEFFVGNDDDGSIGCNLLRSPDLRIFFATFKLIRARPDVENVLVAITDYEEENKASWPFSDAVYIFTDANKADIQLWVEGLQADDVVELTPTELAKSHAFQFEPDTKIWMVWWD